MQEDASVLVAAYSVAKYIVGVVFAAPFILWNRQPFPCFGLGHCFPTQIPAAILTFPITIYMALRVLALIYCACLRKLVWESALVTLVMLVIYSGIVPLYDGISEMRRRSVNQQNAVEFEQNRRLRQHLYGR